MPDGDNGDGEGKVYYFDGSNGCEYCESFTGYYFDEEPEPPHDHCNCPCEELPPGSFRLEFRDFDVDEQTVEFQYTTMEVEACDSSEGGTVQGQVPEDEMEGLGASLKEAAEDAGWSEPAVEDLEPELECGPHSVTRADVMVERYVAMLSGDLWIVFIDEETGDELGEEEIGHATGNYEKNVNATLENVDSIECGP
jgi:hypothetical protein